jgi:hypothetical protein
MAYADWVDESLQIALCQLSEGLNSPQITFLFRILIFSFSLVLATLGKPTTVTTFRRLKSKTHYKKVCRISSNYKTLTTSVFSASYTECKHCSKGICYILESIKSHKAEKGFQTLSVCAYRSELVAASVILYHSHCADGHTCDLKQQQ